MGVVGRFRYAYNVVPRFVFVKGAIGQGECHEESGSVEVELLVGQFVEEVQRSGAVLFSLGHLERRVLTALAGDFRSL
jgi:hypothetical protein